MQIERKANSVIKVLQSLKEIVECIERITKIFIPLRVKTVLNRYIVYEQEKKSQLEINNCYDTCHEYFVN